MNILVTNDDGIDAAGIQALYEVLDEVADVWVVAPSGPCSAQSHAFSLHRPLRVERRDERRWAVDGTPADCVYVALYHLLTCKPDWVVSGVNEGSNLGTDVLYSGTVAAAMEGMLQGVSSLAVSLHVEGTDSTRWYDTAARVAQDVLGTLPPSPEGATPVCYNLNTPNVTLEAIRGLRAAELSRRHYSPLVSKRIADDGEEELWIGGRHQSFAGGADADGMLLEQGWATITPLHWDWTDREKMSGLRGLIAPNPAESQPK